MYMHVSDSLCACMYLYCVCVCVHNCIPSVGTSTVTLLMFGSGTMSG